MSTIAIRRRLAYRLLRLGFPGIAGLALTLGAVLHAVAVVLPERARHAESGRRIAEASATLRALEQSKADGELPPAVQLAAFYRTFPKDATIPDWLATIHTIANGQKLELEIGEYSFTRAKAGRLDQFRIVLPVKGSYPQVRRFIAAARATAPALALDSLFLKRDKVGDGIVDARIVFLLYLEKAE